MTGSPADASHLVAPCLTRGLAIFARRNPQAATLMAQKGSQAPHRVRGDGVWDAGCGRRSGDEAAGSGAGGGRVSAFLLRADMSKPARCFAACLCPVFLIGPLPIGDSLQNGKSHNGGSVGDTGYMPSTAQKPAKRSRKTNINMDLKRKLQNRHPAPKALSSLPKSQSFTPRSASPTAKYQWDARAVALARRRHLQPILTLAH